MATDTLNRPARSVLRHASTIIQILWSALCWCRLCGQEELHSHRTGSDLWHQRHCSTTRWGCCVQQSCGTLTFP
ncbi:uncharacterized protein B0I36DRAFT_324249 [Microdochium trichocladiopsis]|uniref:Secreted protein n=1 Tax=Microdochium trichocladiopsis TaxID=1682393 RepID=A0A9P9BR55_9PEZI|nr:uncharacterized protein B0I36DRAFT_324249 [Microdochium trichocladiopsis]KAH7031592.1 hypothetical protein B0I36DRAFT_324249 [Microdochium trichocladiopsis]